MEVGDGLRCVRACRSVVVVLLLLPPCHGFHFYLTFVCPWMCLGFGRRRDGFCVYLT